MAIEQRKPKTLLKTVSSQLGTALIAPAPKPPRPYVPIKLPPKPKTSFEFKPRTPLGVRKTGAVASSRTALAPAARSAPVSIRQQLPSPQARQAYSAKPSIQGTPKAAIRPRQRLTATKAAPFVKQAPIVISKAPVSPQREPITIAKPRTLVSPRQPLPATAKSFGRQRQAIQVRESRPIERRGPIGSSSPTMPMRNARIGSRPMPLFSASAGIADAMRELAAAISAQPEDEFRSQGIEPRSFGVPSPIFYGSQ